jgi:hypothetical protein
MNSRPSALQQEVDRNFERVCVMEQRQFITMKLDRQGDVPESLREYVGVVEAFNAAFDDHKAFEVFYSSGLDKKTRENALILDKKHDTLREKFLDVRRVLFRIRT